MGNVAMMYCVPPILSGLIHLPFHVSVLRTVMQQGELLSSVTHSVHAYIPEARTNAVRMFLEGDAEWLWFLDYDLVFNPDTLPKLLEVVDPVERPIVCGLYFIRLNDGQIWPCWLEKDEDGDPRNPRTVEAGELREVFAVSMGCTMIHRSVLEKMEQARPDDPWPWFGHDIYHGKRSSEDMTFCMRARELGFPSYGYAGVVCDHIKTEVITWRSFGDVKERQADT